MMRSIDERSPDCGPASQLIKIARGRSGGVQTPLGALAIRCAGLMHFAAS